MAYEKQVSYVFEVEKEPLAIIGFDSTYFEVEEVRKNGQEDSHMRGVGVLAEGVWEWSEESFSREISESFADAVLAYVQANGLPDNEG